jgi:hypothetical protein
MIMTTLKPAEYSNISQGLKRLEYRLSRANTPAKLLDCFHLIKHLIDNWPLKSKVVWEVVAKAQAIPVIDTDDETEQDDTLPGTKTPLKTTTDIIHREKIDTVVKKIVAPVVTPLATKLAVPGKIETKPNDDQYTKIIKLLNRLNVKIEDIEISDEKKYLDVAGNEELIRNYPWTTNDGKSKEEIINGIFNGSILVPIRAEHETVNGGSGGKGIRSVIRLWSGYTINDFIHEVGHAAQEQGKLADFKPRAGVTKGEEGAKYVEDMFAKGMPEGIKLSPAYGALVMDSVQEGASPIQFQLHHEYRDHVVELASENTSDGRLAKIALDLQKQIDDMRERDIP